MDFILNDLGLEAAEEFEYFENFADLMESEAEFESGEIAELLSGVDMKIFSELTEEYFSELLEHTPDGESDMYVLLDGMKNSFLYFAKHFEEASNAARLAEGIASFRSWFSDPEGVSLDSGEGTTKKLSVMDALSALRLAKIDGDIGPDFDFSAALEYALDGYDLDLSELGEMIAVTEEEEYGLENGAYGEYPDGFVPDDYWKEADEE